MVITTTISGINTQDQVCVAEFLEISHKLLFATKPAHLGCLYQEYLAFRDLFEDKIDFTTVLETFESKFGNIWVHLDHLGCREPPTSSRAS